MDDTNKEYATADLPWPSGAITVGDWSDAGERPFRLPATSVEDVTAAVDGFQGRDGFTSSLVALSLDSQVVIGGAPVSIQTFLWPAQARQLAGLLLDLADQCDALGATVPI